jgi:hypothetical protein
MSQIFYSLMIDPNSASGGKYWLIAECTSPETSEGEHYTHITLYGSLTKRPQATLKDNPKRQYEAKVRQKTNKGYETYCNGVIQPGEVGDWLHSDLANKLLKSGIANDAADEIRHSLEIWVHKNLNLNANVEVEPAMQVQFKAEEQLKREEHYEDNWGAW